jgi:hypothetical protein
MSSTLVYVPPELRKIRHSHPEVITAWTQADLITYVSIIHELMHLFLVSLSGLFLCGFPRVV